ncbi:MAG: retention module-containing protein, partial [Gammaproteobacteria bacterium]|nr:retention module-containing protein [Gammaproteobacteria bacterium]
MAGEIGIIKTLIGTVIAVDAAGSSRKLLSGDRIFSDELIKTGLHGAVEIEFSDGSTQDLGSNSLASVKEMFPGGSAATSTKSANNDVESLQQAIAEGADPTVVAQAPAAGTSIESGENEGHNLVSIDYLAPEMTPESGFDTKGIERERDEFDDEEHDDESDDLETDVNDAPTITVTANDFTEDAGAMVGDVAGTYVTADEEGDDVTVSFTTGTNANNHYTLDQLGNVYLTQAGLDAINAGEALDAIDLTVTETASGGLTDTDTDT